MFFLLAWFSLRLILFAFLGFIFSLEISNTHEIIANAVIFIILTAIFISFSKKYKSLDKLADKLLAAPDQAGGPLMLIFFGLSSLMLKVEEFFRCEKD